MDQTEPQEQSPDEVFVTAVLFESALAVVALLLGWLLGPSARQFVPELDWGQIGSLMTGVGQGLVAAIPILVAIELIRRVPWEPILELERLTDDRMIRSLLKLQPSELIVISLCAGIGEELLFRGWLMYWIADGVSLVAPEVSSQAVLISSSITA